MKDLADWEIRIMELEERLRPIAKRPVDITVPNWLTLLKQSPHPLDEADVRADVERLLEEAIDEYQKCGEENRQAIRKLFEQYSAFSWAATLPYAPTTDECFRRHVVLFSIKDLARDTRDAILWLRDLCHTADAAGVVTAPILQQVAELSSDVNKHGMGSTRRLLLLERDRSAGLPEPHGARQAGRG